MEHRIVGLDNPIHLLFLLVIVLLIFGAKRLPEMGRSLGSGLRGFKESINGETHEPPTEQKASEPAALAAVEMTTADNRTGSEQEVPERLRA